MIKKVEIEQGGNGFIFRYYEPDRKIREKMMQKEGTTTRDWMDENNYYIGTDVYNEPSHLLCMLCDYFEIPNTVASKDELP
jgi:hypothetical protein